MSDWDALLEEMRHHNRAMDRIAWALLVTEFAICFSVGLALAFWAFS